MVSYPQYSASTENPRRLSSRFDMQKWRANACPPLAVCGVRGVWCVQEKHEAVNEVMLLASINCPYVVKYYDSFMENDELHIVMEYCNRCDTHLLTWSQGGWERTMRP